MNNDAELLRARWFAGVAGFFSAGSLPVLLLFSCAAPKLFAGPIRYHTGGKPLPAITDWLFATAEHLPVGGFALCGVLFGPFVLAYSLLLVAVCRAGSTASVALGFALWVGLLLTAELLVICLVAFALLLPFASFTGKLLSSRPARQGSTTRSRDQTEPTLLMSNLPLENKLTLVTGASRGIGAAIARRLAEDGAAVLVHYSSSRSGAQETVDAIRRMGREAEMLGADLSRHDGPAALLAQIDGAFGGQFAGRLDVLVNNAGSVDVDGLADVTDEAFDALFNLNVRAVFQLSREAARRMTKTGWGRIINIGSVFGEGAYAPGLSIYCGTKFAVQGLTRGWSRDLGPAGVTVNNVQPAVVQPEPVPTAGGTFDAMKKFTSIGRFGKPEEIAEAVAYLASPKAGFVNGASLTVDGGWSA